MAMFIQWVVSSGSNRMQVCGAKDYETYVMYRKHQQIHGPYPCLVTPTQIYGVSPVFEFRAFHEGRTP